MPNKIKLADYKFNIPGKIDVLLGAEIFYELLRPGQIYCGDSRLLLQNTVFGYVVSGSVGDEVRDNNIHCGLIRDSDLNTTLRSFWELESIGVKNENCSSEEDVSFEMFKQRVHFKNGRYEVELPWKRDSNELSDNFSLAKRRLGSLMRKMQRDKVLYSEYCKVLKNYLDVGIIEKVTNPFIPTNNPVFYLPHQGIIKNEYLTTKLRLVFDASAHEEKQLSLNDCLFHGVNLNPNILDLLISFRSNKIAVLADVEKAFLQISLAPKDRDVVRFLIDDGENGVQVYRFNRVLFGVNASPFLLAATIKTHIGKYMEKYPDTVRTLDHCFYVDDLVTGKDNAKSAFDLSSKAAKIMSEAGMNLRKWISNDCELMKQWQLEHFDHLNMNDFVNHPHRVLGLLWHPQKDYLSLCLTCLLDFLQKRKNTKRFLLMAAGRIFDPLGFASPFTIRFKILFQEIWQRKTDWDEELLPDIREKFEQWCSEASFLCELQIPRYALQCDSVNCPECEIHTFSDASIKAYGAVSYVRLRTFDKISVHLLASKSRVAPLKVLTLPRLELMGALLAARLAKEVSRVLNEKISTTNYFWTDSTIALSWIQGPSNRWKVFVANRVKEIRSLTDKDSWRHCPGKDNPSDLLTRGISADSLINCEKWWKGPSFLQEGNTVPVSNNVLLSDESAYLEELKPTERKTLTVILDNNLLNHILSVSNNFQKNLCIFSYIYRFISNCKRPSNKQIGPLRMCEIQRAEITLVKLVQQMEFNSEIKDLSCKGMVNPQSKIRNLSPFLDSENVLRVGGRLAHSKLCFDKKHQIILPNNHRLTNLILEMTHKRHLHVGPQTLLSIVRQRFWPLNGRNMCRKLVNNCIICFKAKPVTCSQIMGQLPAERISQSFPFNKVGIDFCGHFWIKYPNQRKGVLNKVYVCIFVCMVTKACHLEIVTDLSSEAFIAALKRFFSRRGKSERIFSDNATNFVGTQLELKRLREIMSNCVSNLSKFLCEERVEWSFIPPRAPNHGGWSESRQISPQACNG
ncbi:integrase catalytic domain-containing protein [Trichonephila clavipes]|nr:integrase catalytic domain-containing protein [Trichonephila clavipes]